MGKRATVWMGATAALASLCAGCGSGSATGDESTAAGSTSKAAFIKDADAICAKASKQTEKEYASYAKKNGLEPIREPTPAQYEVVAKTILIPSLRQQVDEIRNLDMPPEDKDQIAKFLQQVEEATKSAEKQPVTAAKSPEKLLASAHKTVKDYGFKICGQPQ